MKPLTFCGLSLRRPWLCCRLLSPATTEGAPFTPWNGPKGSLRALAFSPCARSVQELFCHDEHSGNCPPLPRSQPRMSSLKRRAIIACGQTSWGASRACLPADEHRLQASKPHGPKISQAGRQKVEAFCAQTLLFHHGVARRAAAFHSKALPLACCQWTTSAVRTSKWALEDRRYKVPAAGASIDWAPPPSLA